MSDLKDKVELARKIILLNGADLRYDEVTSISDLLGDLLGNIEELEARELGYIRSLFELEARLKELEEDKAELERDRLELWELRTAITTVFSHATPPHNTGG